MRNSSLAVANNTGIVGINNNETARLRGNEAARQIGPGKLLEVMPGDTVDMEAYYYYQSGYADNGAVLSGPFLNNLLTLMNGAAAVASESQAVSNAVNNNAGSIFAGAAGSSAAPRAYLNYILFDRDFNYVTADFIQVGGTAATHAALNLSQEISEKGYLYVYVSNESNNSFDVYFDDLRIVHHKGKILQEDHYYPFGLNISALSSTAPLSKPNNFRYNGKEFQPDFDMGWYDYGWRMYDPTIGRWNGIDPYADIYEDQNPYNYALNDPIRVIDPDGSLVVYVNGFRLDSYVEYFKESILASDRKRSQMTPPWEHDQRLYKTDVYDYWGDFDWQLWNGTEQRRFVDGMYKPTSTGDDRFKRGEREGRILGEKIKSKEITLEDGELIKLVGHSHGGAHAMGMAQGLLDAGIDPSLINVILLAPHQPNQTSAVDNVTVYQFSRANDKVSSQGAFGSHLIPIMGATLNVFPDGNDDGLGNHGVYTYTTEEFKKYAPELYQYFIDQGILNPDGSLNDNEDNQD